jgi:hypothetical protein
VITPLTSKFLLVFAIGSDAHHTHTLLLAVLLLLLMTGARMEAHASQGATATLTLQFLMSVCAQEGTQELTARNESNARAEGSAS